MQSLNTKYTIDGVDYDVSDIDISEKDLNTVLGTQPGKFMFVATKAAEWGAEREALEYELKSITAQSNLELRDNYLRSGLKKPTEDEIESRVLNAPKVQAIIKKLNRARLLELQWKALEKGYGQRKDDAVEMAKNMRAQYSSLDPQV